MSEVAARLKKKSFFGGLPKDNPLVTLDSNAIHYRELTIVSVCVRLVDLMSLRLPVESVLEVFFFFQAEDGIRDPLVTGVQTCALPIYLLAYGNIYSNQGAMTPGTGG